jgi:hypothetical protein
LDQVSLLIQREWRARYPLQPAGYVFDPRADGLGPEATPLETTHACWTDVGILFCGAGRSALIRGSSSFDVTLTDDAPEIAECVAASRETSLEAYLAERAAEL